MKPVIAALLLFYLQKQAVPVSSGAMEMNSEALMLPETNFEHPSLGPADAEEVARKAGRRKSIPIVSSRMPDRGERLKAALLKTSVEELIDSWKLPRDVAERFHRVVDGLRPYARWTLVDFRRDLKAASRTVVNDMELLNRSWKNRQPGTLENFAALKRLVEELKSIGIPVYHFEAFFEIPPGTIRRTLDSEYINPHRLAQMQEYWSKNKSKIRPPQARQRRLQTSSSGSVNEKPETISSYVVPEKFLQDLLSELKSTKKATGEELTRELNNLFFMNRKTLGPSFINAFYYLSGKRIHQFKWDIWQVWVNGKPMERTGPIGTVDRLEFRLKGVPPAANLRSAA